MNNIMWFRRGEEIIGVLCNWDLAEDQQNGNSEWRAVNIWQVDAAAPSGEGNSKSVFSRQSQHLPGRPSNLEEIEQPTAKPENKLMKPARLAQFLKHAEQYDELFEGAHADFKPAIDGFLFDMWLAFGEVSVLSHKIAMIT
ncbi:hypothetical protein FOMPIDRAFT_90810 [Fomitopsis schrenkii]|uniref:Uncharacterized protein n=1 Tax=Fomitopsis schrenkii TaxID=2126942 RepID=S8E4Y1_FOMSC|nr:hypothetical protein FOMPIDRAFT_90810 [Fomitopsis schrenkii]